jgi:hypothetical protein
MTNGRGIYGWDFGGIAHFGKQKYLEFAVLEELASWRRSRSGMAKPSASV